MPNDPLASLQVAAQIYDPLQILVNAAVGLVLGVVIALVYKHTHKGLSYAQSFTHTIVFIALIVAIVMMVIGNSLSRAFALVGALSIIRFRTVVKDTKDTAFVFMALAAGMAAGTSNHFLAVAGTAGFSILAVILHKTNFGAVHKSELMVRFLFETAAGNSSDYVTVIGQYAKRSNLLHMEPTDEGKFLRLTYDISLREEGQADQLAGALSGLEGVTEVTLVASGRDIHY